jgi:hypothetical protein
MEAENRLVIHMGRASTGNRGRAADGLPNWTIRGKIAKERRGVDGEQMAAPSEAP